MPTLEIILRTHDGGSVHNYAPRIVGAEVPKAEIVKRCFGSLVRAVCVYRRFRRVELTVFDDHSSEETVQRLKYGWNTHPNFRAVGGHGNNASMQAAFAAARDSKADLVYLVEDDYLHAPSALVEMVEFYQLAVERGVPKPAVHPYDDADNYKPNHLLKSFVVPGAKRHWRSNTYSTATVLAPPSMFADFWEQWYTLAVNYEKDGGVTHEGNTINRIWREAATLFTPLPSLAVHLNENEPPLFDWRALWEESV